MPSGWPHPYLFPPKVTNAATKTCRKARTNRSVVAKNWDQLVSDQGSGLADRVAFDS
jgi:hypothetical protein